MTERKKELHFYIYQDIVEKANETRLKRILSKKEQVKILKAVSELPYPCNTILEEYYLKEMLCKQVILKLGISRNKFYSNLNKGKFLLRQQLNSGYYDKAKAILYGAQ